MQKTARIVYDLASKEGVNDYITGTLLPDIRTAFESTGALRPFGVAFGSVTNGTKLHRLQPMVVGGNDRRSAARQLIRLVRNSQAVGCVFASRVETMLVVQLEHPVFGDSVWAAHVTATNKLGQFRQFGDGDELPLDTFKRRTSFHPARYMS